MLNEFPELSPNYNIKHFVRYILHSWSLHLWYVNDVVCVKPFTKSKIPKVVVTYWKTDEVEEDGENVTMTIYGLLADYIAGDLNLSELNT